MRSSVTVMFNNPPPETTMSYPDYKQRAKDHGSLLILVKQIGQNMAPKCFNVAFDRICRLQHIKLPESQTGGQRGVWVRYKRNYAIENNEWGDFQAHRKVLGLICIGKCGSQDELDSLCAEHEKIRERYLTTLYDSRCVVFGEKDECHTSNGSYEDSRRSGVENVNCDVLNVLNKQGSDQDSGVFDTQNADVVDPTKDKTLTAPLIETPLLMTTVDGSIQSKSVEPIETRLMAISMSTNGDSLFPFPLTSTIPSPSSPMSPAGSIESSSDTPTSPRSLADDVPSPSDDHSSSSTPTNSSQKSDASSDSSSHCPKPFLPPQNLKTTVLYYKNEQESSTQLEKDLYDFICSLFWVLESKRLDRSHEKVDRLPLLYAPFEKKDFVGLDMDSRTNKKRCVGRMKKHIGDLCLLAGLPTESISYYNTATDLLKSANDWLWLAGCYEGLCAASVLLLYPQNRWPLSIQRNSSFTAGAISSFTNRLKPGGFASLPNGLDPVDCKSKSCLSSTEIIEKYKEAMGHYRKYHSAAIIELEASIKACQVLIQQEKYLLAAEFLHNVVSINLQLSEEEKIRRFSELSRLYKMIGFHRKAAFFKRVAAMRCVTPKLPDPNWSECYHLLLQTLDGYKLSLDPKMIPKDKIYGWPVLQIQILQELVATSRRMGSTALSVRHMTFLLHCLFDHLSTVERKDFAAQLESLTARCEGGPVPLALDNGLIIPPVNLINLPKVKTFKLQNLAPHLQPVKMFPKVIENTNCGPFIFSPLQLNVRDKNKNSTKMNFTWVEGDVCEVSLQVFNPLPFELRVMNMGLLPDGIAFETFPTCLSLPPESGPHPVNLLGTPRSTGELVILGYTTHVLGVKSDCRLKDVQSVRKPFFTITVVPALPQIQVVTSLPKSPVFPSLGDISSVVTSAQLSLYAGESCECVITLINTGKENVESVEVLLDTKLDKELEKDFCSWNLDDLKSQFPIEPSKSASFNVVITAVGDFLSSIKSNESEGSDTSSLSSSQTPSKVKSARASSMSSFGSSSRSSFSYSSFRGKLPDFFTPQPRPAPSHPPVTHQSKTIEAIFKLRYSGGPGKKAGYCRQCSVAFNLEVIPSVVITKWDVLPAESPSSCYLVLDVLNATDHEMEMQYAPQKQILIEARNTCRIPVPIERCPLAKLSGVSNDEAEKICRQHVSSLVDLKWSISATDTWGKASIASLMWNPSMFDMLKMGPLQWEVSLNEHIFKVGNEFSFVVGEAISISISMFNYSDSIMTDLCLSVQCYQDYQNAQISCRVDGKLLISGCDKVFIGQIAEKDSYVHVCGLVFFYPGVYKLDVQCRSLPPPPPRQPESVVSIGAFCSRTWRCTPPIEVTVTE